MKKSAIARIASIFLALLIIGGSFFSGYYTGRSDPSDVDKVEGISNPETDKPDLVDFSAFWKVWNVLNEKFVATGQATTSEQEKVWPPRSMIPIRYFYLRRRMKYSKIP